MNKRKHKPEHNNSYFIVKALLTQAKTQTQATNTRIKMFPFPCAYTYAYAATSENEIPLRNNTSTRIFITPDYVWPMKILDSDYLAPKQFGRFR